MIKLNTNENPYDPSPKVAQAVAGAIGALRLYPPTDGGSLRSALAEKHDLPLEYVFCGNGSDEVLALAFLAFFGQDRKLCSPALTYSFYPVYAQIFDVPYTSIPMKQELVVDIEALLDANCNVALANPNAPTTIGLSLAKIRSIAKTLRDRGQLLLLDEAYADFAEENCIGLIKEFDNLLIVRTMSKSYSLAGLRVGYALGQPPLIQALLSVKDSFNSYPLDALAIAGGTAAVQDEAYLQKTLGDVVATREDFTAKIRKMGFEVPDSRTNFLFVRHKGLVGREVFGSLRAKGILVRHFDREPIAEYLRITIGTREQMELVVKALGEIVEETT